MLRNKTKRSDRRLCSKREDCGPIQTSAFRRAAAFDRLLIYVSSKLALLPRSSLHDRASEKQSLKAVCNEPEHHLQQW
jgi:hypothetical protein